MDNQYQQFNPLYRYNIALIVPDLITLPILLATGFAAGVLNVIAGGGSFFTLPILIFLGLPATVANGTNRIGILMQSVPAVWGFHRFKVMNWQWALIASVPALIGVLLGAWIALHVNEETFRRILSIAMLIGASGILLAPNPVLGTTNLRSPRSLPIVISFFLVGLYGGFLQAGVGFVILTITTWCGLDLVRGNAVKVLINFLMTSLALLIFTSQAQVNWAFGLSLGIGNFLGGEVGVRLAILKGHNWIKGIVTITVIILAIGLWLT